MREKVNGNEAEKDGKFCEGMDYHVGHFMISQKKEKKIPGSFFWLLHSLSIKNFLNALHREVCLQAEHGRMKHISKFHHFVPSMAAQDAFKRLE